MATDSKTQHLTTFSGGMNTDTSDAYLDKTAYRFARNLRYITNTEENSGELHMIEGTVFVDTVGDNLKLKKATTLRNVGIAIYERTNKPGWEVWSYNKDTQQLSLVFSTDDTKYVVGKAISVVTKYEDDDNLKLYIADGSNPILVINIAKTNQTDINKILSRPQITLPKPRFCGLIPGSLKAGVVEYSYQLYTKHGAQSEISVSTKLIPLRTGNCNTQYANIIEGYEKDTITNKGVKIRIPQIDSDPFDHIKIYRITYIENGQMPTIELVYDDKFSGDQMYFSDTGTDALEVLSLEEYNSMTGIHIIPKVIESKDDYLFAANIKNDNPIYDIPGVKEWPTTNNPFTVNYTSTITLTGEANSSPEGLDLNSSVSPDTFRNYYYDDGVDWNDILIGDFNDTYANPKVSYAYKSYRRGETYRFGIILYDAFGNSTGVKYIGDFEVPYSMEVMTRDSQHRLRVMPIGVRIKINEPFPDGIVSYEIVRCGRSEADTKNISQGVLARPVRRFFQNTSDIIIDETYPLTPTGWVTTADFYSGYVSPNLHVDYSATDLFNSSLEEYIAKIIDPYTARDSDRTYYLNALTNVSTEQVELTAKYVIHGNYDIYQFVSPEICYMQEDMKQLFAENKLHIRSLCVLAPDITYTPARNIYFDDLRTDYYYFGNQYARLAINNKGQVRLGTREDSSITYVDLNKNVNFNQDTHIDTVELKDRFAYVKLYENRSATVVDTDIVSKAISDVLNWDDYAASEDPYPLKYTDKVTAVGGTNFVNWVSGGMYGQSVKGEEFGDVGQFNKTEDWMRNLVRDCGGLLGPGGRCAVFLIKNGKSFAINTPNMSTFLCNVYKDVTPYGGTTKQAIEQSTYRSYGDIYPAQTTEIITYNGDTFIQPFEYISMHRYDHGAIYYPRSLMVVYAFPIETSINIAYSYGNEFSKMRESTTFPQITYIQDQAANVNGKYVQEKPLYLYNSAYSANSYLKTLASQSTNEDDYGMNLDYRVYHSLVKSNNESIDNWLKFQSANFLDVDTRLGGITGLRRFHNQLVFWLEQAAGLLSVNERTTITDESNLPLILGNGGVLARYDYLPTSNGMKADEYADTQSDTTLYWWDHNKAEICAYSGGQQMLVLSKVKLVQNYINTVVKDGRDISEPILSFDKKFNEALFTISDQTLVYNEHISQFTSVYDVQPDGTFEFPDSTYMIKEGDIYKWNELNGDSVKGFDKPLTPYVKYIVNDNVLYTKVFDNAEFGGRVYKGDDLRSLKFRFTTPLKQEGFTDGSNIVNREYNFRYVIPRNADAEYGDRLRGKTMQCEMWSEKDLYDFSLQFILNKYRISWS